jgi:hypothetical protein
VNQAESLLELEKGGRAMAIAEPIISHSVWVGQTDYLSYTRSITLKLQSGTTVYIGFPETRPAEWLQFGTGTVTLSLTADQYDDVYHVLQTEDPAFCTALDLFGLQVGAVHTELDLSMGEPTAAGYNDQSLEALVVRARQAAEAATTQ